MTDQTNFNDPRWNPDQHSLRDYERDDEERERND